MDQSNLFSHLRALSQHTTAVCSFTTPVLPLCSGHAVHYETISGSFNNSNNYYGNCNMLDLGQSALSLDVERIAEEFNSFSDYPLVGPLSTSQDLLDGNLTSLDRCTDVLVSSELCPELLPQFSTSSKPMLAPLDGFLAHSSQHDMTLTAWSDFIERLSSAAPLMAAAAGCHFGNETTVVLPPPPTTTTTTPKERQIIRTVPSYTATSFPAAPSPSPSSKATLSEATGNKNRRAKRNAKVGELYSTGSMKRQSQPKPYDKMVKKYRLKL